MQQHIIDNTKAAPTRLGKVLILGLGKSGRAAADYCLGLLGGRVASVTIAAGDKRDDALDFADECVARGARVLFDTFTFEEHFDVCIVSPGISQFSRFYENAQAASSEIMSEVEFAWRESAADAKWVAITGTNGKTTTTSLIAHLFKTAGYRTAAVGNIGNTCIEAVAKGGIDVYVVEASSFQLASMIDFAPEVAVLLNITPDHLYWHKSMSAYIEAKKNVYMNLDRTKGTLVIDGVNSTTRGCVREFKDDAERGFDYIPLGCEAGLDASMHDACGSENAAYLSGNMLTVLYKGQQIELVTTDELLIKGEHNASNALAAASAAISMGVDLDALREGLRTFEPLEHRLEPCGSVHGVDCFNDSKATNVDATLKALGSFPNKHAVFLLGGHDKGTELDELVDLAEQKCAAVVCFGAAGPRFYQAFEGSPLKHILVPLMEDALDMALAISPEGGVVVLSPACASFDEFEGFEHRGKVFKSLVAFKAHKAEGR